MFEDLWQPFCGKSRFVRREDSNRAIVFAVASQKGALRPVDLCWLYRISVFVAKFGVVLNTCVCLCAFQCAH
ncbi:hypothetical protein EMCRGX_G026970 [Ephydatia muelleri]